MRKLLLVPALLGASLACEEPNPCDEYAEYVCACKADDTGFDCDGLLQLAESPTSDVASQCAVDLAALEEQDAEAGETCTL